ncbi:MAG: CBS domain-containing protein, partial [Cyanobacteria bacterium J06636_28]
MASDEGIRALTFWDEVIDTHPLTASGQTLLPKVLTQLVARPESSCVLVLHHSNVVGIVTRQDLVNVIAQRSRWTKLRLATIMTHPVIT